MKKLQQFWLDDVLAAVNRNHYLTERARAAWLILRCGSPIRDKMDKKIP